jgi:hypothetical protein
LGDSGLFGEKSAIRRQKLDARYFSTKITPNTGRWVCEKGGLVPDKPRLLLRSLDDVPKRLALLIILLLNRATASYDAYSTAPVGLPDALFLNLSGGLMGLVSQAPGLVARLGSRRLSR